MKDLLFLLADLWMIYAGFACGVRFIRRYDNYLLGLEWMVVATSGTNFLAWSLFSGNERNPMYDVAYFFDAFSRSIGITLILVMGLMRVTHRYKPSLTVDVGVFALATVAGLYLQQFRGEHLHVGPATFYVVVMALTAVFLGYYAKRLWQIGARSLAVWCGLATAAGLAVALMYDFFPFADDKYRTNFYIIALATWGTQLFVYFRSYRAMHDHNTGTALLAAADERRVASA